MSTSDEQSPIAARAQAARATRRAALRRWTREIAIVLAIFAGVQWWQSRGTVEGRAPALEEEGLDGPLSLSALKGQAAVVHFWATWCGVCRAEEGSIDAFARQAPMISVAVQSGGEDKLQAYRQDRGVSFPMTADPEGRIATRWGVTKFPTTFFIAPDGTIRSVSVGWTSSLGLRARLWWASRFSA